MKKSYIIFLLLGVFILNIKAHNPQQIKLHELTDSTPEKDSLKIATRELGTVVVSATRSQRKLFDVPMRIDLLDKEQIEQIPALSADDYLRAIPGISVSRGAAFLGSSTVSMRGMGSEAGRTLVLVDGVPVNKTDGGSVNWNAINAEDIERIEVLKGPGSSIHGGNAMGGVINLISPVPSQKLEGFASQHFGTFETFNTNASVSGRQSNFFWGLNGRYRSSDGYITTPVDEIDEYSVASFLDEHQYGGRAGYFISADHMVEIAGSFYRGKRGTGSNFSGFGFTNDELAASSGAFNEYTGLNGRLVYRYALNEYSLLNITLYGQRENYQNIRESLRSNTISRYDVESVRGDVGLLSTFTSRIGQSHHLTTGIDIRNGSVDGADVYVTATDQVLNLGKLNQLGLFLQDEIVLGDSPWSLLAGFRFDYANFYDGAFLVKDATNQTSFLQEYTGNLDNATFSAFSPRISLQYHKENSYRVYVGYSRGFRAPVLDDLCRTGLISGGMKLANPDLLPEYLNNLELGGDIFIANRITISPAVYYSQGTDYHAFIGTGDSLVMNNRKRPIRVKDNIGKVDIVGAELALKAIIVKGLSINLSYSYTETKIQEYRVLDPEKDEMLKGKSLTYQPKDIFFASLNWRNPIVNVFISFHHKGNQWLNDINTEKIDAFNYVDLQLWRGIFKGVSLGVKVHNLFDQDFVDSRNLLSPGRMVNAELKYSF